MLHIKFWRTKYIFVLEIFLEVALWGQVLPLSNISILHSLNGLIFKSSLMIPTFHANFRALIVLGSIYQLILLWCQRLAFCNKLHMFVVIIGSSPGAIFFWTACQFFECTEHWTCRKEKYGEQVAIWNYGSVTSHHSVVEGNSLCYNLKKQPRACVFVCTQFRLPQK